MTTVFIDESKCEGCQACIEICPRNVFESRETGKDDAEKPTIEDEDVCLACMSCQDVCPSNSITLSDLSSGRLIRSIPVATSCVF